MRQALLRLAALGVAALVLAALLGTAGTGRATAAELALRAGPDWDHIDTLRTIDTDPGGKLKWDPKSGRIQICDKNPDGHLVRGYVTRDGKAVKLKVVIGDGDDKTKKKRYRTQGFVHIGSNGHCKEGKIIGYKAPEKGKPKYGLRVCLASSNEDPDGYCNTSDSNEWPHGDIENNSCWDHNKSTQQKIDCVGGVDEYCHQWQHQSGMFPASCMNEHAPKEEKTLKPPVGRSPDIYARPDLSLPHSHPKDIGKVTAPVGYILRWLVWTVMGSCVAGFVFVGGRMTIRHGRGEVGANATEIGWVLVATLVAGSGCVIAVVQLLVDPF